MIDNKIPLDENQFAFVVTGKANRNDYFKYKISHYENDNENDENFPRVHNLIQPVIINARQSKRYEDLVRAYPSNEIDSQFLPDDVEGNVNKVNAFYGYPRQ